MNHGYWRGFALLGAIAACLPGCQNSRVGLSGRVEITFVDPTTVDTLPEANGVDLAVGTTVEMRVTHHAHADPLTSVTWEVSLADDETGADTCSDGSNAGGVASVEPMGDDGAKIFADGPGAIQLKAAVMIDEDHIVTDCHYFRIREVSHRSLRSRGPSTGLFGSVGAQTPMKLVHGGRERFVMTRYDGETRLMGRGNDRGEMERLGIAVHNDDLQDCQTRRGEPCTAWRPGDHPDEVWVDYDYLGAYTLQVADRPAEDMEGDAHVVEFAREVIEPGDVDLSLLTDDFDGHAPGTAAKIQVDGRSQVDGQPVFGLEGILAAPGVIQVSAGCAVDAVYDDNVPMLFVQRTDGLCGDCIVDVVPDRRFPENVRAPESPQRMGAVSETVTFGPCDDVVRDDV